MLHVRICAGGRPQGRSLPRPQPSEVAASERMLPSARQRARQEGRLRAVRRGCRRGESRALSVGGWTKQTTAESGYWSSCGAEPVEIPAVLGYDGGVWYAIRQGVCGVLVSDEHGAARAYPLCKPASHYYAVMTRSAWMPVLIGERI